MTAATTSPRPARDSSDRPAAKVAETNALLQRTRIPEIDLYKSEMKEVIEACRSAFHDLGIARETLRLDFVGDSSSVVVGDLSLRNVPADRALLYACLQANCRMVIQPGRVEIHPLPGNAGYRAAEIKRLLSTEAMGSVAEIDKLEKLRLPTFRFDTAQISLESNVDFFRFRALDLDEVSPEGDRGVPMVHIAPRPNAPRRDNSPAEIDDSSLFESRRIYEGIGVTIAEAIQDVAGVYRADVFHDGYAVVFIGPDPVEE